MKLWQPIELHIPRVAMTWKKQTKSNIIIITFEVFSLHTGIYLNVWNSNEFSK